MFLGVCGGDIALAQAAALETVNDYRGQNRAGLLAVALIVAYGLAALGSLSLSMADDISSSMALRLRGNANALNRAAEQNRRALKHTLDDADRTPYPPTSEAGLQALADENLAEDTLIAGVAAAQKLAALARARTAPTPPAENAPLTAAEQQNRAMWASAMARVAGNFTAGLATMRPDQRRIASMKAAALTTTVHDLLSGAPLPALELAVPR
jgi:hypothetical protein